MRIARILFPTDFSHTGDAALSTATALARDSGATLLIVHVAEEPKAYSGGDSYYNGPPAPSEDDLNDLLCKVTPHDKNVPCIHILSSGDPATRIVEIADEEQADLIVLGTHGRSGLLRTLLGSVAEAVVRKASVPVLTFKQGAVLPSA